MELQIDYFNELLLKGNEEFEFIFRTLLSTDHEEIYTLIEDNSDAFIEPLLCSYYNPKLTQALPIEQLLIGYVSDKEKIRDRKFNVKSNRDGIIYIPRLGYFYTNKPDEGFMLMYNSSSSYIIFDADEKELSDITFEPVTYINDSNIEICKATNSVITQFFEDGAEDIKIGESAEHYLTPLSNALDLIKTNFPFYYEWLNSTVRGIVLFNSTQRNSFASIFIKGTAFINVKNQVPNETFFLEEITHQCGHVLFYPMSINKEELFNCDYSLPMSTFSGIENDDRDVLNAFYAFFPQYFGDALFDMTLDRNLVADKDLLAELMGRFSFRMYKYGLGVKQFDRFEHVLSEEGKDMFNIFKKGYHEIYDKRKPDFDKIDVSKQVYTFDLELFKKENYNTVI